MRFALLMAAALVVLPVLSGVCAPGISDWSQAPDMVGGIAYSSQVNVPSTVADDWISSDQGITVPGLSWYGAYWKPYDVGDFAPNSATYANADPGGIAEFTITMWTSIAATADRPFDHPGTALWTYQASSFTETATGATSAGRNVYRYDVTIPVADQFVSQASAGPTTYWLSVEAYLQNPLGRPETARQWGWLESANGSHNLSSAVEDFKDSEWYTLTNNLYSSDMAFTIQQAPLGVNAPEPGSLVLVFATVGLFGLASRIRRSW